MKRNLLFLVTVSVCILIIFGMIIMNKEKKDTGEKEKISLVNGEYNLNLIKTVNNGKHDNYLISPYSIEIALRMLMDGAKEETYDEIYGVIGNRSINDISVKDRISVANAAFIRDMYKDYVNNEYYDKLKKNYDSEILYDEYRSPKVINDWVNNKTKGMIEKILDNMSKDFVMGLANALAIDVEWEQPFSCEATISEEFMLNDGKKMNVEMMHKTYDFGIKYINDNKVSGIIIPYKSYDKKTGEEIFEDGRNLEFIGILPEDINSYINNLSNDELYNLLDKAKEVDDETEVNLSLPRFKYDYSLDDFKEILEKLGIKKVFSDDDANLEGIITRDKLNGNLYVSDAIHKTHIDLNEKGTKAAAVTYFGLFKSTGKMEEKKKVDIKFDKPFIYMIRDKDTNEMLFFGAVYKPNKWAGSTCSE
jgi:serine protease inhibitor